MIYPYTYFTLKALWKNRKFYIDCLLFFTNLPSKDWPYRKLFKIAQKAMIVIRLSLRGKPELLSKAARVPTNICQFQTQLS